MKFEILHAGPEWFFHIVAANGRFLAHSETYKRRRDAIAAVKRIIRDAAGAKVVGA